LRSFREKELRRNHRYREAEQFAQDYEPIKGRSYQWVYEDAVRAFNRATDAINTLDRKAEGMIKYVTPGTGLFGLAFAILAQAFDVSMYAGVLVAIGIAGLLASIISCLLSLCPHQQTLTPSVHRALQCADYEEYDSEQAIGLFTTGIGWATVGKIILTDIKATYLRFAYRSFTAGLVLIFAGLCWTLLALC